MWISGLIHIDAFRISKLLIYQYVVSVNLRPRRLDCLTPWKKQISSSLSTTRWRWSPQPSLHDLTIPSSGPPEMASLAREGEQTGDTPVVSADYPLRMISQSFQALVKESKGENGAMPTEHFAAACAQISILFKILGVAFKFAEGDYVAKVQDLEHAASTYANLTEMVNADVSAGSVRTVNSHTRNLLRVKRGVQMMKLMFDELFSDSNLSLKDAAGRAYNAAFAPYHGWAVRKAVALGLHTLPNKHNFLKKLKEDEKSWSEFGSIYVAAAGEVLDHVDNLFTSRNLGLDW